MSPAASRPESLDRFIGRERELVRSRSLLRSARLLTLVGPPGVGKTRLARELSLRAYRGEVCFVALHSLTQAGHLPQVVAAAMGERNASQSADVLAGAIGNRRLLIVLDNCEHLADPVARLTGALLRHCDGLRVLATSREPLRVPGEVVFTVGPLPVPEPGLPASDAAALRFGAVALFVARAQACHPGFTLGAANTGVVIDICRRLDGLPLAIELAARRVGSHSPEEILADCDDRLTLPPDDDGTVPRHRSELRAAIQRSYRLLTPAEQAVFRRVSILLGEFGLAQAAAVCGMEAGALRPVLSDLAAKSLIMPVPEGADQVRFRLLNTIRAYGCERHVASGELASTRDRAIGWLMTLATSLLESVFLTDELERRLRAEGDNLIAAVEYTVTAGGEQHVVLVLALARYWRSVGEECRAHSLLQQLLAQAGGSPYRTSVLAQAAGVMTNRGDPAEAARLAGEAVSLARREGVPLWLAKALDAWGRAQMASGDVAGAIATAKEEAGILHTLGRTVEAARSQGNLAWALAFTGRTAEARQTISACLPVLRVHAPPQALASVLHTAATVALAEGDLATAEAGFAEGLAAGPPETFNAADQIDGLAVVAAKRGDARRALCLSAAAAAMRARIGVKADPAWRRQVSAATRVASRQLGSAKADAARAAGRRLRGERLTGYAAIRPDRRPAEATQLTARERQVADLVAKGLTNRDIAGELGLSGKTVSAHLDSIRDKLGFRTRTQIAVWAATPRDPDIPTAETVVA